MTAAKSTPYLASSSLNLVLSMFHHCITLTIGSLIEKGAAVQVVCD
jgi:predicted transcriptional regulator